MISEPAQFIDFREPVARKQHKCCECGRIIDVGERYEYVFGVWDGQAETFKTCLACSDLGKRFRRWVRYDYNPPFGLLRATMADEGVTEEDLLCMPMPQKP